MHLDDAATVLSCPCLRSRHGRGPKHFSRAAPRGALIGGKVSPRVEINSGYLVFASSISRRLPRTGTSEVDGGEGLRRVRKSSPQDAS